MGDMGDSFTRQEDLMNNFNEAHRGAGYRMTGIDCKVIYLSTTTEMGNKKNKKNNFDRFQIASSDNWTLSATKCQGSGVLCLCVCRSVSPPRRQPV